MVPAPQKGEEYLVIITNNLPADTPVDLRDSLVKHESIRVAELIDEGLLVRLWRIPGRRQNVSIWNASGASELQQALASLPLFPYLDITVTPLTRHPSDLPRVDEATTDRTCNP